MDFQERREVQDKKACRDWLEVLENQEPLEFQACLD